MEKLTCYEDLVYRGLIKDMSNNEDFIEKLNSGGMTFYIGTDPTADSLHLGHLSSFLICERLSRYGHNPIVLVGGATGLIGDPRPTKERDMAEVEKIFKNIEGIRNQLSKLFPKFKMVNNYDWFKDISFIDFLRDVGKYFNVPYMLNKDIVKRRLDEGISYTEFSYQLMQAYDFLYLFEHENCVMEVAGQDQWGNITSGLDLIRKKTGKDAYAFTMPLVTTKSGVKFGKSEGNALWLDKSKTSSYDLYQYLMSSEDDMVINYLKVFTFLTKEEIDKLELSLKEHPEKREASKTLAYEVVKFLHGSDEADAVKKKSEEIFSTGGNTEATESIEVKTDLDISIVDFLMLSEMFPSKSEARRMVEQNAISINGKKITNPSTVITKDYINDGEILIQKGKRQFKKVIIK